MSAIDNLKDKLKEGGQKLWSRVSETSLANQIRDRYHNLSAVGQKTALIGSAALFLILLLAIPLGSFLSSVDEVGQYSSRRDLIHALFKSLQESQDTLGLTPAPQIATLQARIEDDLKNNQILPDQIKSISQDPPSRILPKETVTGGLAVNLTKLNLRQIVDVGYLIQSISTGIKITDLDIRANFEDVRYFDVVYRLVTLNVPAPTTIEATEPEAPTKAKKGKPQKEESE